MNTKTPISLLQEISVKYGFEIPKYDLISSENVKSEKKFEYTVKAFGLTAIGSAGSKQDAKHKAAHDLLEQLKVQDKFKDILLTLPAGPQAAPLPEFDVDPVSSLIEMCAKIGWSLPTFTLKKVTGASHSPEFTMICQVKNYFTEGTSTTKKNAKKNVAKEMQEVIRDSIFNNSNNSGVSLDEFCDELSLDQIFTKYRKLKKTKRKPSGSLVDRHLYFEQFPDNIKNEAKNILRSENTNKEIVYLFCKAMDIKFELSNLPQKPRRKIFELIGEYDCVLVGNEPEIWDDIVAYFKVMLNIFAL